MTILPLLQIIAKEELEWNNGAYIYIQNVSRDCPTEERGICLLIQMYFLIFPVSRNPEYKYETIFLGDPQT